MHTRLRPLLIVTSFAFTAFVLLLFANPSAYAEPLQQASTHILIAPEAGEPLAFAGMSVTTPGYPYILYEQGESSTLITCLDSNCTDREVNQLPIANVLNIGVHQILVNPGQGFFAPTILYFDAQAQDLRVARCFDTLCAQFETFGYFGPNLPEQPRYTLGANLLGGNFWAYPIRQPVQGSQPAANTIQLMICQGGISSGCRPFQIDSDTGTSSKRIDITTGLSSGNPYVAYYRVNGLTLARCESRDSCLTPQIELVAPIQTDNPFAMIGIRSGVAFAYQGADFRDLYLLACTGFVCQTSTPYLVDSQLQSRYGNIALAQDMQEEYFVSYTREDLLSNTGGLRDLILARCRYQYCHQQTLGTTSGEVFGATIQIGRNYILYSDLNPGGATRSLNLYIGEIGMPPVTPTPSQVMASRTPNPFDLTVTAAIQSLTPALTWTPTPSQTPTPTKLPTLTMTPSYTASVTLTPSETPTPTETVTGTLSATPLYTATFGPTVTLTPTPFATDTNVQSFIHLGDAGSRDAAVHMDIASNGLPVITWQQNPSTMVITRCQDMTCTARTTSSVSPIMYVVGMQLDSQDRVVFAHRYSTTVWPAAYNAITDLYVARCNDLACSSFSNVLVANSTMTTPQTNHAFNLLPGDRPLVAYREDYAGQGRNLNLIFCETADCSIFRLDRVIQFPFVFPFVQHGANSFSVRLNSNQVPVIAYNSDYNAGALARCETSTSCAAPLYGAAFAIYPYGMVLDEQDRPRIVGNYYDPDYLRLALIRCNDPSCWSALPPDFIESAPPS